MKERTFNWMLLVIAVVLAIVLFGAFRMAYPQDVDVRQSNDQNLQTTGDVSSNNKTFAFGNSMGDVDIAGCLGSTQFNTPLYGRQKLVINWPCMAEFYLRNSKYALASMALCNVPGILEEFASEIDCEIAHDFKPDESNTPDLTGLYNQAAQFDEHYELAQQQEQEIEYLQEEQASLVGRLDALTVMLEQAPAQATATPPHGPQFTDEQVEAVWAALKGSEEDND